MPPKTVKRLSSWEERHKRQLEYVDLRGDSEKIQNFYEKYSTGAPEGYIPKLETRREVKERKILGLRLPHFKYIERECGKSNNEEKCLKLKEKWSKIHKIPFDEFFFDYYASARGIKLKTKTRKNKSGKKAGKSKSKKHTKTQRKLHKTRKSKK
jgi:hypothetical protein